MARLNERRARCVAAQLSVSEEECEALLESNNIALFVDNVRAETAEARRALRDVEARHEELARLEAALVDVRDLFTQLAHLVAQQVCVCAVSDPRARFTMLACVPSTINTQ